MTDATADRDLPTELVETLETPRNGIEPAAMLTTYVQRRSRDRLATLAEEWASRTSADAITAHHRQVRSAFREAIGGFPDRVPLDPVVCDQFRHAGVVVESVRFTSRPHEFVSGTVYRPDPADWAPPYPGVVVACGHAAEGKATDLYQLAAQLLAREGILALVFDPVSHGERSQLVGPDGTSRSGSPTRGHMLLGVGGIPLGRSVDQTIVWDGIRAVDYLVDRADVDGTRIGMTGNSGGGTQTAYVGALDDRILAAAPSCYITSFDALLEERIAEDVEQNVHNQLGFGLDHPALLTVRAPAPTLVCAATDDFFPIEGTWSTVRQATRLYGRLGYPERFDVVETDGTHGYHQLLRETVVGWMVRWLREEDRTVAEPAGLTPLAESDLQTTPSGHVSLLEDAGTRYEAQTAFAEVLANRRDEPQELESLQSTIHALLGLASVDDLPAPTVHRLATEQIRGVTVETLHLECGDAVWLPAIYVRGSEKPPQLVLDDDGVTGNRRRGRIDAAIANDAHALFVEPRGIGTSAPPPDHAGWDGEFGRLHKEALAAYRLGESIVGLQTTDVAIATQWLADQQAGAEVTLEARGNVGIPALHTAVLVDDHVGKCQVAEMLRSWEDLARTTGAAFDYAYLVHGVLEAYDLPDLVAARPDTISVADPWIPEAWDPTTP